MNSYQEIDDLVLLFCPPFGGDKNQMGSAPRPFIVSFPRTYRGHKWCYISEESDCRDAQRSRKFPILKWSHSACRPEFTPVEHQPPKQPLQPPKQPLRPQTPPRDFPKIIRPRGSFPSQDDNTGESVAEEVIYDDDSVTVTTPIKTKEELEP